MFRIGCHISSAGGYLAMAKRAEALGANTFAFFTRNPAAAAPSPLRRRTLPLSTPNVPARVSTGWSRTRPTRSTPARPSRRWRSLRAWPFPTTCSAWSTRPVSFYNFHPGSHVGQGIDVGIGKIAALLNEVLFPGMTTTVLLETMAGKGSEVGGRFEQLRAIIDCVQLQEHVGVCLDTCHVWDAGYDIAGDLDGVLAEFDRVIGLERLHAVHLNNSLNPCGCHKDRHAKLLDGCIPPEALVTSRSTRCWQGCRSSLRHRTMTPATRRRSHGCARRKNERCKALTVLIIGLHR